VFHSRCSLLFTSYGACVARDTIAAAITGKDRVTVYLDGSSLLLKGIIFILRETTSLIMSLFKVNVLSHDAMQSVVSTINNIIHCHDITNILIDFAVSQSKWNMHTSIADLLQPTPDITLLHLRVRRRLPFKHRYAQANFCRFTIKDWVHVLLAVVNTRETKQLLRSLSYNQYYYIKAA